MPHVGIYGHIPPALLPRWAVNGTQYAPLNPGAASLDDASPATLAGFAMLAPAGTQERRYAMAQGLQALAVGAPFTMLAPRDKGGARIAAELRAMGCNVVDESKQHHRICSGTRPAAVDVASALADGAARFDDAQQLWTQPGIFSWDRPDAGSCLLVHHLPALRGRGADLGCGLGFLARAVLASPDVTHLTLLDIDRRAVAMAARNNEAARTDIRWADATHEPLSDLDFIVMNPPFHRAGIEDRALGQAFIRQAASGLRAGGSCWLVANRHMPYEDVMEPLFSHIRRVAEADGFKIYEAVK